MCDMVTFLQGFPSSKEPTCQYRRQKRPKFDPWVRKIPWRREWLLTAVFLPGESYGQKSRSQRDGHDWATNTHMVRKVFPFKFFKQTILFILMISSNETQNVQKGEWGKISFFSHLSLNHPADLPGGNHYYLHMCPRCQPPKSRCKNSGERPDHTLGVSGTMTRHMERWNQLSTFTMHKCHF